MYVKHIEYKNHMQFLQAQINRAVRLLMETMGGYLNIKFIHFVLIEQSEETIELSFQWEVKVSDRDDIVFTLDFARRLH